MIECLQGSEIRRNVTLSASYGDKFHRLDKQVQKIDSVERAYEYTYEDGPDARLKTVALPTGYKTYPKYDNLGRSAGRIMRIKTGDLIFEETIAYLTGSESTSPKYTRETNYVTSIKHYSRLGSVTETTGYGYDKNGNIETVTLNGVQKKKYTYDGLNRLTKEVNTPFGTTTEYEYDAGGNITQKRVSGQAAIGYGYDTANKDRLISYNGETIGEYDAQGNPWKYRGKTLSWAKRGELTQFGSSYYAYNANGVRTSKNGIKYFYNGQNLIKEEHTDYSLWFFYDERGIAGFTKSANANSVTSSDTSYYYRKNAEGDITHLYSQGGDLLARYEYNAWGEVRVYNRNGSDITEGSNYANEIGRINPIRYRGYYYDEDTKLYYLINRYYDPEVGRFINADDIAYLSPFILGGVNLFAYCNNNPVMYIDPEGLFIISVGIGLGIGLKALAVAIGIGTVVAIEAKYHPIQNTIEGVGNIIGDIANDIGNGSSGDSYISTDSNINQEILIKPNITTAGSYSSTLVYSRHGGGKQSEFIGIPTEKLLEWLKEAKQRGNTQRAKAIERELKNRGERNRRKRRDNPHMRGWFFWFLFFPNIFDDD